MSRSLKAYLIWLLLASTSVPALSQPLYSISGRVTDSSQLGLAGATVCVSTKADSIQTITTAGGQFHFSATPSRFTLSVVLHGYKPWRKMYTIDEQTQTYTLPVIALTPDYQELQAAFVSRQGGITIKADTVSYLAGSYKMREGSLLQDLVQRLPGITLNADSGVMAMGQKVKRVLLDGQPFYNGDVMTALHNLPYDIIDKVELIDDYGEQARVSGVKTGDAEKVINIVLRKDKNHGVTGIAEVGAGNDGQYLSSAAVNAFNGDRKLALIAAASNNNSYGNDYVQSADLSHADRWGTNWSGSGNALYIAEDRLTGNNTIQDSYSPDSHLHLTQSNSTKLDIHNEQANYEAIYQSGDVTKLKLNLLFNNKISIEDDRNNLNSNVLDSGYSEITQSSASNHLHTLDTKWETHLLYEQLAKHLTIQGDLQYEKSHANGDYLTQIDTVLQHDQLTNDLTDLRVHTAANYYIPINKTSQLEAGYAIRYQPATSRRRTSVADNTAWTTVDSLSNNYRLNSMVQDGMLGWSAHRTKLDLRLNITAEPGNLKGISPGKSPDLSDRFFNLLPNAALTWSISRSQKIRLALKTTVNLPGIAQMQPITDLSNPQFPVTGNPQLKPTLSRAFTLGYDQNSPHPSNFSSFGGGVSYVQYINAVATNIVYPKDSDTVIQHTYYLNVNGGYLLGLRAHFNLPLLLRNRLKISGWANLNDIHSIGMINNDPFTSQTVTYGQSLSLFYSIPSHLDIDLSGSFNHTSILYPAGTTPGISSSEINVRLENKYYFLRRWSLSSILVQQYNSGDHSPLQTIPIYITASLGRSFFPGNQCTASLEITNLTNSTNGYSQISTPNNIVQTYTNLEGRICMFKIQWQFERLKTIQSHGNP
jgi:Outer membrane protein beta-barrel family/Carboxypeptidase regulatory-like domain